MSRIASFRGRFVSIGEKGYSVKYHLFTEGVLPDHVLLQMCPLSLEDDAAGTQERAEGVDSVMPGHRVSDIHSFRQDALRRLDTESPDRLFIETISMPLNSRFHFMFYNTDPIYPPISLWYTIFLDGIYRCTLRSL